MCDCFYLHGQAKGRKFCYFFYFLLPVIEKTWQSDKESLRHVTLNLSICVFLGQIFVTFLSLPLSQIQLTPSVSITRLRQVLDHHAPLVTRTVTDRTSAPWMTLEVKQAKVERHIAER